MPRQPQVPLGEEIASAERHALLQRVLIYPASLRRKVVQQSLDGASHASIAAQLLIPLSDVQAVMEAFNEFADEQAI